MRIPAPAGGLLPALSLLWLAALHPVPPFTEDVTRHGKQAHLGPPTTGSEGGQRAGEHCQPQECWPAPPAAPCPRALGAGPRGTASLWEGLLPWRVFRALLLCHLSLLFLSGCKNSACSLSVSVKASFTVAQAEQKLLVLGLPLPQTTPSCSLHPPSSQTKGICLK